MAATKKLTADEITKRAELIETFAEQIELAIQRVIAETPERLLSADDGTPYCVGDDLETMTARSVLAVKNVMYCWL